MQQEDPLSQTPQRSCAKLVTAGGALRDVVRQAGAHVMDLNVGERAHRGIAQRRNEVGHLRRAWRWIVASRAANRAKQGSAGGDRRRTDTRSVQHDPPGWWRS